MLLLVCSIDDDHDADHAEKLLQNEGYTVQVVSHDAIEIAFDWLTDTRHTLPTSPTIDEVALAMI